MIKYTATVVLNYEKLSGNQGEFQILRINK